MQNEAVSDLDSHRHVLVPVGLLASFALVTSCFALWGVANNMTDVLVAQFRKVFSLSDLQSGLVQTAFYSAYFFLALPAGLFIRRYSYKAGVLLGLSLFALGGMMFYPAAQTMAYEHFLLALFVLACGLSILETSANPYVLAMGPPETATRRLNLAQSFNSLGAITGVMIGKYFILIGLDSATEVERQKMTDLELQLIQTQELLAVLGPYLSVSAVIGLVWLMIAMRSMPDCHSKVDHCNLSWWQAFVRLLSNKVFLRGVVGQFLYVGSQIGCWSYTIRYVMVQMGGTEAEAASYLLASVILMACSRFVCTALMGIISPAIMLGGLAFLASILCTVVIFIGGMTGVYALVLISGCMSLMFPTIFGLSLAGIKGDYSLGGSCLIMAILGGALLTALMGMISDSSTIEYAFIVPLMGFLYLVYFGFRGGRQ